MGYGAWFEKPQYTITYKSTTYQGTLKSILCQICNTFLKLMCSLKILAYKQSAYIYAQESYLHLLSYYFADYRKILLALNQVMPILLSIFYSMILH